MCENCKQNVPGVGRYLGIYFRHVFQIERDMIAEKINRQREIEVSKTITQNNKVKNNDMKIIRPVVKKSSFENSCGMFLKRKKALNSFELICLYHVVGMQNEKLKF